MINGKKTRWTSSASLEIVTGESGITDFASDNELAGVDGVLDGVLVGAGVGVLVGVLVGVGVVFATKPASQGASFWLAATVIQSVLPSGLTSESLALVPCCLSVG